MTKEPILSFIVPVYKKPPEVFEKCLASLFDCSLKDIEVICVFDGANEELELVAKRYPKVLCFTIEHGGAPKARNYGLEMSRGKYVVFWDADCYVKPEGPKRWVQEFEAVPDADFVYFGYDFAQEGIEPFRSETFNAYSLTCGNYISSMSPIKREKALKWDESLDAAQDWDYWLTAVEQGLKGVWIEGSGFVTDTADSGLSSTKWNSENREKTISRVREKHGIVNREIGVYSLNYPERGIKLAEILGGDLIKMTGPNPSCYKTIFNLGYNFLSRWDGIAEDVTKIQYWIPGEIAGLKDAKYNVVMETIRIAKKVINYCNTDYEKNKLEELGISAEVLPLPLAPKDIEKVSKELPEKFSILVATDKAYADLLKDLSIDLPHIDFKYNAAKTTDVSCLMYFYQFAALDSAMLVAHVNGRHVISNVQAPYCGFVDPDQNWETFKLQLYEKIRQLKVKPFNQEAQDYYLEFADPKKFKDSITSLRRKVLEVI
jgi:glycosyltransferase involved in cell wall biosynthesis